MIKEKGACVIDKEGHLITFVLVKSIPCHSPCGILEIKELPQGYDLKDGEQLLYVNPPLSAMYSQSVGRLILPLDAMLKPRWNGDAWEETATPDEIEKIRPKPQ